MLSKNLGVRFFFVARSCIPFLLKWLNKNKLSIIIFFILWNRFLALKIQRHVHRGMFVLFVSKEWTLIIHCFFKILAQILMSYFPPNLSLLYTCKCILCVYTCLYIDQILPFSLWLTTTKQTSPTALFDFPFNFAPKMLLQFQHHHFTILLHDNEKNPYVFLNLCSIFH